MRINQRSAEELAVALNAIETELTIHKPTKAIVLRKLASMGWCSLGSTGIEKSFLAALKAKGVTITPEFATLMGVDGTATNGGNAVAEPATAQAPATGGSVPNSVRLVNLKAVSSMTRKGCKTTVKFIGSDDIWSGDIAVSSLRPNCNLIEFVV